MFSKPKETSPKTETSAKNGQAPSTPAETTTPQNEPADKSNAAHEASAKTAGADAQDAAPTPPVEEPADAAKKQQPSPEAVELAALKERYARLMADFDNFRKRQVREREDWLKRANEDLLGNLLPTVDHLELAIRKATAPDDPFVAGVRLVYDQLLALLDRYGMTPIDAKGQPFDPAIHEALSQMSSATVPANAVIDQFRRGWRLAGRLLRPAQVIVSSGAPDEKQAEAEASGVSD